LHDQRKSNNHFWQEWIKSWTIGDGSNDNTLLPKSYYEDYTTDELNELARLAHATPNEVRECITTKYETFEKDWNAVRSLIMDDKRKESMSVEQQIKQEFAELYSLVLSRTTNLGPEWGNQLGVIPFHDMINHPPYEKEPNVELFCVGDIRATIGNDNVKLLFRPLLTEKQLRGEEEPPIFMDRDFVIAARRRIEPNEELFLSYKNSIENMDGKQQLWLMLQYGFPFVNHKC
jgi:hypothetical protein